MFLLLRPCNKWRGQKKLNQGRSINIHEILDRLIAWPHKTSTIYQLKNWGHSKCTPYGYITSKILAIKRIYHLGPTIHTLRKHEFRNWPLLSTNSTKIVGGWVWKSPQNAYRIFEWYHFHQSLRRPVTLYFYINTPSKKKHFLIFTGTQIKNNFWNLVRPFWKNLSFSTLADLNPGVGGPWDMFRIFVWNVIFIVL